jgi:hypothetical protein
VLGGFCACGVSVLVWFLRIDVAVIVEISVLVGFSFRFLCSWLSPCAR